MKTQTQKLASATKILKQQAREIKAAEYQIGAQHREAQKARLQIAAAELYICYLTMRVCDNYEVKDGNAEYQEITFPMAELVKMKKKYQYKTKLDKDNNITIRIEKIPKEEGDAEE
jgi:hypothetical protein